MAYNRAMSWFNDQKRPKLKSIKKSNGHTPAGMWKKCSHCEEIVLAHKLEENAQVCPYCDFHFPLSPHRRLQFLVDPESFEECDEKLYSLDPLNFVDKRSYGERLQSAQERTGKRDAVVTGLAAIAGRRVSLAVMDFSFMGGSMGVVTGEKIARAMDRGVSEGVGVVIVSCSGGARMQEGILSLMQMAKTSASRSRLQQKGLPLISVLTHPTTGGCAASFAMQGDINIAEPHALIGFAGPRVIEQSIRQTLPEGFQRSEFLKEHGFVDCIVHRRDLSEEIGFFLKLLCSSG